MREDYAIAADLCEEHGLVAPAQVLRDVANWVCEVYLVRPRDSSIQAGEVADPTAAATSGTRRLFTTRDAADHHAAHLKATSLRATRSQPGGWEHRFTVPEAEFCRQVGDLLGTDYRLSGSVPTPLIPAWASDEQAVAIARLVRLEVFEVVAVLLDLEGDA